MTRELLCMDCAPKFKLHEDDASNGMTLHKVSIRAKLPPELFIEITAGGKTDKFKVTQLVCDLCNEAIPNGSIAVAATISSPDHPYEPWESEYGEVLGKDWEP